MTQLDITTVRRVLIHDLGLTPQKLNEIVREEVSRAIAQHLKQRTLTEMVKDHLTETIKRILQVYETNNLGTNGLLRKFVDEHVTTYLRKHVHASLKVEVKE